MIVGDVLGPYQIRAALGEGGMAEVWEVFNQRLHRAEAMKVIKPHLRIDQQFVSRFLEEARRTANLHHPNIAVVYSSSAPEELVPYFTMELLQGEDLARYAARHAPLSPHVVRKLLQPVAEALDYAHSRGVIHRDVKPANIHIDTKGHVRVLDFGIARAVSAGPGTMTLAGQVVGTPAYMSPEQAGSGKPVCPQSDQYSLAMVAYKLLTGNSPFPISEEDGLTQFLIAHVHTPPQDPKDYGVSPSLSQALLRALAKTPGERFPDCRSFLSAWDAAPVSPSLSRPKAPSGISPGILLGALALLMGSGLVVKSFFTPKDEPSVTNAPRAATPGTAKGSSPSPPPSPQTTRIRKGNVKMRFVRGGTFTTGQGQQTTVPNLWMDTTPVTVGQYRAYCAATGNEMPKAPRWGWIDDHPMVYVSWRDAQGYAKWAGGRLPSSTEFEYAARNGGKNIAYPWGDTFDAEKLWCSRANKDAGQTAAVNRQSRIFTSSTGLSDMAGNVWQWCGDSDGNGNFYLKGGSWGNDSAELFRCSKRLFEAPQNRGPFLSFRLCLEA